MEPILKPDALGPAIEKALDYQTLVFGPKEEKNLEIGPKELHLANMVQEVTEMYQNALKKGVIEAFEVLIRFREALCTVIYVVDRVIHIGYYPYEDLLKYNITHLPHVISPRT
jgi:hypothetical protein